jgi:transcriptional regulator with XRE-family HTH domain
MPVLPFYTAKFKALKSEKKNIPTELKTIGDHLKKKRLESNLYQRQVGEIIGVDEVTIFNWENKISRPSIKKLPKIVEFLGYVPIKEPNNTFPEKLKSLRKKLGFSQKKLAIYIKIDQTTIRKWEAGIGKPSKKLLKKIMTYYPCLLSNAEESSSEPER